MAIANKKNSGFTLIEIMLVVVLMSLSAVAVVMNLPEKKQDIAKEQAQRFYYRLQLLNEHAILNGEDLGIRIDENKRTYTYMKLNGDGWQVFENKVYVETQMQDGVMLAFEVGSSAWSKNESLFEKGSLFDEEMFAEENEEKKRKPPQIFVLSSGELTPFHLLIHAKGEANTGWVTAVTESGSISLIRAQELDLGAGPS